jgi:hypothetical protein
MVSDCPLVLVISGGVQREYSRWGDVTGRWRMPFDIPYQSPISDLEILVDARKRIVGENTWVQRRFRDGERHCLVAALSLACGSRNFNMPNKTERRLARLLAEQLSPKIPWRMRLVPTRYYLMSFNDHPRTCQEDVVAVFDRTICSLTNSVREYVLCDSTLVGGSDGHRS